MKQYKISLVIPVYNGEIYLRECFDSILAQTFHGYELVLIDDGSKDSSGAICDEYANKHENIRVFHKANEGINQTRHYGVNVAQGEWIVFCDQDDTMPNDALQVLWDKHEDTDIVIGYHETPAKGEDLTLSDCRRSAITAEHFPPAPWAKLYRKTILTDDVFEFPREIDGEEDMIMNIRLMFRLTRPPHFVYKKVYNFRRNTASVSHTKRASLEHEDLFDRVRSQSIPPNEIPLYMKEIIFSRLNGLTGPAFREPEKLCDKKQPYMQRLHDDIKKYSYKLNFQEWMLLNIPFAWMYRCFSFLIMVKKTVRYRLNVS